MIAKHNIKVNGQWYSAGEQLPEEKKPRQAAKPVQAPVVTEEPVVSDEPKKEPEVKAEQKARYSGRNKSNK